MARVSDEAFVKAWLEFIDKPLDDLAKKLGLRTTTIKQRATRLRRDGVKLPKRPVGRIKVETDVKMLNALIKAETT